jgi:hypothetical protein
VNAKNNVKETALHYCCAKSPNVPAARVLLRARAQTDLKGNYYYFFCGFFFFLILFVFALFCIR